MNLSSKYEYIFVEKKAGISSQKELIKFLTTIGKKIVTEKEITKDSIVGIYIDHRIFQIVKFSKGKRAYNRFKKYLTNALKDDENAHTKTKRMRGQIFLVPDPSKLQNQWLVKFFNQ